MLHALMRCNIGASNQDSSQGRETMKLEFLVQRDNIIANSDAVSFRFRRNTVGSLGLFLQLRGREMSSGSSISLSVLHFAVNCFLLMPFILFVCLFFFTKIKDHFKESGACGSVGFAASSPGSGGIWEGQAKGLTK